MAARSASLAKLIRPKLYDALPRPRLFDLLDEAARRPIVWLTAPPGSGKTTLVASWLDATKRRYVWYQADSGDTDAATFVHYMRAAATHVAGKAAAALPVFSPEPHQDLSRFARTFFRDFFGVLPKPCAVVFDNFQEMRAAPEGRVAFASGLDEIPEDVIVVIVSRTDPPREFARLVANGRIARIDEAELRCTGEEARGILGSRHVEREVLERIQAQCEGWVAALVLLREHLARRGAPLDAQLGAGKDAIFQYFAGEIFGGARQVNQRTLMLTAIPPSITADEAVALSGSDDAPQLLEYLSRRHLFVDRRRGDRTTYHFHALFREFLQDEIAKRMPPPERRAATVKAAELLVARGQVEDALGLYRDASEWDAMRALIHTHALDWARQGRATTLSGWIEALPRAMRDADPWLEYWVGRAWIFVQPERGRPALERALAAFKRNDDLRGQALALNTSVTGYYYEWADFTPLAAYLPEFERLLAAGNAVRLDAGSELRARAAWIIALLMRDPEAPQLAACAERLAALLDGEPDVNVRMMAASTLLNYINWKTKGEAAAGLVARVEPIVARPEVTPLMQVWWRTHLSFWHYINGRYSDSTRVIVEARALAERYGLEAYLFEVDHAEASALINNGEHAAAKARLDAMERGLSPARRMHWPYYHYLRSMLEQRLGNAGAATRHAEQSVRGARELQLPALQMPHFLGRLAQSRAAGKNFDAALIAIDEAIGCASPFERNIFEQRREGFLIERDLEAGDEPRALERLATVLADYRERNLVLFMRSRPALASHLLNLALLHNIEPDYTRMLIERNNLVAPPDAAPAWPFKLRISLLGAFELERDGQPVTFAGKAQQKPLDLLKLLVALGGTNVDSAQMTSALWPDADGAAAKVSFDSTLFRLRKLLDIDNALVLAAGRLSLSRELVWTDVWALEAALEAALALTPATGARSDATGASAEATAASVVAAATRVLAAYRGPLLGADDAPWIAKPRDALRAKFVRALLRLGEALEARREWTRAVDVYRRGLEADNLAESFYRGLMRSLAATGNQAEALGAFRRCRELLSIVLGVKPSAETEQLHKTIAG